MFSNPTQLCSPNVNSWNEKIWGFCSRVGWNFCWQCFIYSGKLINTCYFTIFKLFLFNAVFMNPRAADSYLLWSPSYLTHSWFITNQLLFTLLLGPALPPPSLRCAPLLLTSAAFFVLISFSAASPSASPFYTVFIKCLVVGILILARLSLHVDMSHKVKDVRRRTFPTSIFISTELKN